MIPKKLRRDVARLREQGRKLLGGVEEKTDDAGFTETTRRIRAENKRIRAEIKRVKAPRRKP